MKNLITRLITLFLSKRFVSLHLLGRALILKKRKKLRGTRSIQARKILFVERKASFYLRSREFYAFFFFFFSKNTKSWIARGEEDFYSSSPNKTSPSTCAYICVRMHVCACVLSRRNGRENIIVCATWTSIVRISLVQTRVNFERADELLTLRAEGGLHPRPRYNSLPRFQKRDGNQRIIRILLREEAWLYSIFFLSTLLQIIHDRG